MGTSGDGIQGSDRGSLSERRQRRGVAELGRGAATVATFAGKGSKDTDGGTIRATRGYDASKWVISELGSAIKHKDSQVGPNQSTT